ncbi:hypothetical protein AMATHDRAFT_144894, partial [Amanita thiersii Skay4041]
SMSNPPADRRRERCRIAEIVQYVCNMEGGTPTSEVVCFPVPRLFRLCPGQPAVEVTTLADINMATGEVEFSTESKQYRIKGKSWQQINRY